jgi:hypothetical protein
MSSNQSKTIVFLMISIVLLSAACKPFTLKPLVVSRGGWIDWNGKGGWTSTEGSSRSFWAIEPSIGAMEEAPLAMPLGDMSMGEETAYAETETKGWETQQNPNLRAGSVDDNAAWDDYLLYRLRFAEWGIPVHNVDVSERHLIVVTNDQGQPVLGAKLTIVDETSRQVATLRTHANGEALFFPLASDANGAQQYLIQVEKGSDQVSYHLDRDQREHAVVLSAQSSTQPVRLDVHFLIDATGSMSDEIQQLKDNMIRISEQIHALPTQPNVRFGMTIYRDRGDLFISRTFDFTTDIEQFTSELANVTAEGGGDYAESLNEGFHNAIYLPEWRVEETVSLIFLVADAPPHLDYDNDYDYADDVFEATERGIKVFPLASSGLDDQGEFIFRQLGQISGGKFLFLTYGADGAPGDETTHHVDDYSVLSLDELIVQMVEEELAYLNPLQ